MAAPSKEQFLADLNEDTYCGYQWCKQLYGYHLGNDGFVERVFDRLDELGRDKVKVIYGLFLKWQMTDEMKADKEAGAYEREMIDKNYERQVRECERNQRMTNYLNSLSNEELIQLWKARQI